MGPTITGVESIIHPAPTFVVITGLRGVPGLPISQADEYHHRKLAEAFIAAWCRLAS